MNYQRHTFPSNTSIILVVIILMFSYQMAGALLMTLVEGDFYADNMIYYQGLSQILFMFIPVLFLAKIIPLERKKLFRLTGDLQFKYILVGLLGIIALKSFTIGYSVIQDYFLVDWLGDAYTDLIKQIERLYMDLLKGDNVWQFLLSLSVGALIPAFSEEFLFRGFMQRSLEENNTAFKAIMFSGILFGLIHLNPIQILPLCLFGVFIGYLAYASGNIFIPILIHFVNNAFEIVVIFTGEQEILSDRPEVSLEFGITIFAVSSAAVFFLIRYLIQSVNSRT